MVRLGAVLLPEGAIGGWKEPSYPKATTLGTPGAAPQGPTGMLKDGSLAGDPHDVVARLKQVVKAQHRKIEELRAMLHLAEAPVGSAQAAMAAQDAADLARLKQDNEEYRRSVSILKAELASSKREGETLRKANRRLNAMLEQTGLPLPLSPGATSSTYSPQLFDTGTSLLTEEPFEDEDFLGHPGTAPTALAGPLRLWRSTRQESANADDASRTASPARRATFANASSPATARPLSRMSIAESVAHAATARPHSRMSIADSMHSRTSKPTSGMYAGPDSVSPSPSRLSPAMRRASHGRGSVKREFVSLANVSKLDKLMSCLPLLWRDMEGPSALLRALALVTGRVLGEKNLVVTIFVADSWLRTVVEAEDDAGPKPAVFYLGQGKQELTGLSQHSSTKAEAPCFTDLQSLPYRSRTAMAVAIRRPGGQAVLPLAVVQVAVDKDVRASGGAAEKPQETRRNSIHDDSGERRGYCEDSVEESSPLSEQQSSWLHLVCGVASGLLVQAESLQQRVEVCHRMKHCLEMSVNLNKAKNLRDFEQRLKHMFSSFFCVGFVRILFYDELGQRLLLSAAQQKAKEAKPQSVERGIVGLCARKRQILHIPTMAGNQFLDTMADGLNRPGRPVNAKGSMLCGPLLTDVDQDKDRGVRFLGVVQIMDRKVPRPPPSSSAEVEARKQEGEFSAEEADIFRHILRACTQALLRALKLQEEEMAAKSASGVALTLAKMLAAA